jgi:3-carboxy-cis,cis-muconate cycloisomerase
MEQEHERAAGAWHSEWPTTTDLLTTVGSASSWLAESLASLRVDRARMADAVSTGSQGQLAQALADALTPGLGAGAAHDAAADAVQQARATGRPLVDVLAGRPGLDLVALTAAVAPDVGEAGAQVDAVLADHRRLTEGTE